MRSQYLLIAGCLLLLCVVFPVFAETDSVVDIEEEEEDDSVKTPENGIIDNSDDVSTDAGDDDEDDEFDPDLDTPKIVDGFTEEEWSQVENSAEKHEFQAEVNRLMDIIINSLYTNKEVFLRELLSNAADAAEKARFLSVSDPEYLKDEPELKITLDFDADAKTLSITDTGCGMSKNDLINHLGTVAKSGTTNFLEALSGAGNSDADLIGQFGVGFYSAFLVADKIVVTSKGVDDPTQHVWESAAGSSFSISEDPRGPTLKRGTRVTLHLKEDALEYMDSKKLSSLAQKYSQFVQFPILVNTEKEIDNPEAPEGETQKIKVWEYEQANTQKPIWVRSKDDITTEEYNEFYKSIAKDYMDPASWVHFRTDGEIDFKSVLYLPKKQPYGGNENFWDKKSEIKLYVRRVLIADKFEDILPKYLHFIKGVVDSDDLPLNVNREQLQQTKILSVISKKLTKKALDMIKDFAKESDKEVEDAKAAKAAAEEEKASAESDEEKKESEEEKEDDDEAEEKTEIKIPENKYNKFFSEFGNNIKMGCYEDDSNRSKIIKLLRFQTTKFRDAPGVSLESIVSRMAEGAETIYYASGDDQETLLKSANLQAFLKRDIEVLLLTDHLDEPCIQKVTNFDSKKFVSIQKGDVKFDDTEEDKLRHKKMRKFYKPLTDWWKKALEKNPASKIDHVKISRALVDAPCMVVSGTHGYSAYQEKIMKAQAFQDPYQMEMMAGKRTLEINPNHPLIINLLEKVKEFNDDESIDQTVANETATTLYEVATLEGGFIVKDPIGLSKKMFRLMSQNFGVDPDSELEEIELPEDDEEENVDGENNSGDDINVDDDEEDDGGLPDFDMEEMMRQYEMEEDAGDMDDEKVGTEEL